MIHVRHDAAAIAAGLCETSLITHSESNRSGIGCTRNVAVPIFVRWIGFRRTGDRLAKPRAR